MDPAADPNLAAVCQDVKPPDPLWGGLTPAIPMAECEVSLGIRNASTIEPPFLYITGCILPIYHFLIAKIDGAYVNIDSQERLQAIFAPIDSADEALSYALLSTGYKAKYGQSVDAKLEYFVSTIEDTNTKKTSNGWVVHLFKYQLYGCGGHFLSAVDVTVSTSGAISVSDLLHLSEDPETRMMCVD